MESRASPPGSTLPLRSGQAFEKPALPAYDHHPVTALVYSLSMGAFAILTNRRRAVIALVHSVVFLLISLRQMILSDPAAGIGFPSTVTPGTWILCGIYSLVSAILWWLFAISRGWMEKAYFGLCAVSATTGLLRTAAGDHLFHSGLYIRVVMLATAVVVGLMIVRFHSESEDRGSDLPQNQDPELSATDCDS